MWSSELSTASQDQSERSSPVTCFSPSPLIRSSRPDSSLQNSDSDRFFFPGARVLARHQRDGLYHEGTVVHKLQSCRGLWVVEFCPRSRQLLCSEDMVHFHQSKRLRAGDAVLCPVRPGPGPEPELGPGPGPGPQRFGPGRVVSVTQESSGPWARVLLWDSRVSLCPVSSLCPLPLNLFYRISRELLRPHVCCQSCACLHGDRLTCPSWRLPKALRGQSVCQSSTCYYDDHITCPPPCCHGDCITCPSPCPACLRCVQDQTRTQTGLTGSGPGLRSSPGFSSDLDQTRDEDEDEDDEESVCESRVLRPPWRYWRRTGPEPNHKKPGGAVSRRPPHFSYVTFPSPQGRASANHSAVFQTLINHTRGGGGIFKYRPRPPPNQANQRPRSVI